MCVCVYVCMCIFVWMDVQQEQESRTIIIFCLSSLTLSDRYGRGRPARHQPSAWEALNITMEALNITHHQQTHGDPEHHPPPAVPWTLSSSAG